MKSDIFLRSWSNNSRTPGKSFAAPKYLQDRNRKFSD
jgi:hypothetical protein